MSDKKDFADQLNILFDDLSEKTEEVKEETMETVSTADDKLRSQIVDQLSDGEEDVRDYIADEFSGAFDFTAAEEEPGEKQVELDFSSVDMEAEETADDEAFDEIAEQIMAGAVQDAAVTEAFEEAGEKLDDLDLGDIPDVDLTEESEVLKEEVPEVVESATEEIPEAVEAKEAVSEALETVESVETVEIPKTEEMLPTVESVSEEAKREVVDDTDIRGEYDNINFDDFEEILDDQDEDEAPVYQKKASIMIGAEDLSEDEDLYEELDLETLEDEPEDVEYDEVDDIPDDLGVKARKGGKKDEINEERSEKIRFGLFTAVVALIVAAAVLFILVKRGIISVDLKSTTAATTTTVTTTTTEEVTTTTEEETTTTEEETTTTEEETTTTEEETTTTEEATTAAIEVSEVLSHYTNMFVILGTGTVNVRESASTDAAIIGTIDEFGGGEILEQVGDWYHIYSGAIDGYVYGEYVKTGEEAKKAALKYAAIQVKITSDTVNLRSSTETTGVDNVIDVAKKDQLYQLISETDEFYEVSYNSQLTCYVSKEHSVLSYYLNEAKRYGD